jgi:hypothetical protein
VRRRLEAARREGVDLLTSAIVLGQVWRGGHGRQAPMSRLPAGVDVLPVDSLIGQATGILTRRAGTSDPIDIGHLVTTAGSGVAVLACQPRRESC